MKQETVSVRHNPLRYAFELAKDTKSNSLKVLMLSYILRYYVKLGEVEKASKLHNDILRIIKRTKSIKDKIYAFRDLEMAYYKSSYKTKIRQISSEEYKLIKKIRNKFLRSEVLSSIVDSHVQCQEYRKALQLAKKLFVTDKIRILENIISAYIKNGQDKEAFRLAKRMKKYQSKKERNYLQKIFKDSGNFKEYALSEIARTYADRKKERIAKAIDPQRYRNRLKFSKVLSKHARLLRYLASAKYDKALKAAEEIGSFATKIVVLGEILYKYAQMGRKLPD